MKVDSPLCSEPPCAGGSRLQRLNAAVKKRSAGAQILLSEHMQSLWHSYKPLTRPDRGLLDRSCHASHNSQSTSLVCSSVQATALLHESTLIVVHCRGYCACKPSTLRVEPCHAYQAIVARHGQAFSMNTGSAHGNS